MSDPLSTIRKRGNLPGRYQRPIENRLTENQLIAMDKELDQFREKQTIRFAGKEVEVNSANTQKWLMSKGALNKHGAVILSHYTPSTKDDKRDCDPILYEQLTADLAQWNEWRSKKDFAWKGRIKAYAKTPEAVVADVTAVKEKLTSWK